MRQARGGARPNRGAGGPGPPAPLGPGGAPVPAPSSPASGVGHGSPVPAPRSRRSPESFEDVISRSGRSPGPAAVTTLPPGRAPPCAPRGRARASYGVRKFPAGSVPRLPSSWTTPRVAGERRVVRAPVRAALRDDRAGDDRALDHPARPLPRVRLARRTGRRTRRGARSATGPGPGPAPPAARTTPRRSRRRSRWRSATARGGSGPRSTTPTGRRPRRSTTTSTASASTESASSRRSSARDGRRRSPRHLCSPQRPVRTLPPRPALFR